MGETFLKKGLLIVCLGLLTILFQGNRINASVLEFISTPNLTVTANMEYHAMIVVTGNNSTLTGQTIPSWLRLVNIPDFKGVSSAATKLENSAIPGTQVSGLEFDSEGNLYFVVPAPGTEFKIYKLTPSGNLITVAGAGPFNPKPNVNQTYTTANATFYYPMGLAIDPAGNLYIADRNHHQIRKITISTGIVSTFAGSGIEGYKDATGIKAQFNGPTDITIDSAGNLYVIDKNTNKIRKITPAGKVTTIGSSAQLSSPHGLTAGNDGHVYIADTNNHRILKINVSTDVVTTLAGSLRNPGSNNGTGTSARFKSPSGLTMDAIGNLYVADRLNHRIRVITPDGVVSTLVGSGLTSFTHPYRVAIGPDGHVYVANLIGAGEIKKITMTPMSSIKLLKGTPPIKNIGPNPVVLRATDGSKSVEQNFIITVMSTPPRLDPIPAQVMVEDITKSIGLIVSDKETAVGALSYSVTATSPNLWTSLNIVTSNISASLHLVPSPNQAGTSRITILVSDGASSVTRSFDVTVNEVNDTPVMTLIPSQSVTEDEALSTITLDNYVTDSETTTASMTWTASGTTNITVVINESTRVATLTRANGNWNGTETITFTATDQATRSSAALSISQNVTMTVTPVNDPPTITGTPVTRVAEDSVYSFTPIGKDVDQGETLTYSIQNQPTWATFTTTKGKLTGTPQNSDVGTSSNITISVSDGTATTALPVFNLAVTNTNDAPTLTTVSNITGATEDTEHTITYANLMTAANEADIDSGTTIQFKVISVSTGNLKVNGSLFAGGSNDTLTSGGELKWTPVQNTNGTIAAFTIKAFDGYLLSATAVPVSVNVTPVNDIPVMTLIPSQSVTEDERLRTIALDNYVTDSETATALITWTASGTTNITVVINEGSRVATLTRADRNWNGTETITFTATDHATGSSAALSVSQNVTMTVTSVNDPTIFGGDITKTGKKGSLLTGTVTATDKDGLTDGSYFTITTTANKGIATINGMTGRWQYTHNGTQSITDNFTVTVTDDQNYTATQPILIVINPDPHLPTFKTTAPIIATQNKRYTYNFTAKDDDLGQTPTFSILELPTWLSLIDENSQDGQALLTGTPSKNHIGNHSVTIIAHSGNDIVTQSYTLRVISTVEANARKSGNKIETKESVTGITTLIIEKEETTITGVKKTKSEIQYGLNGVILKQVEKITELDNNGKLIKETAVEKDALGNPIDRKDTVIRDDGVEVITKKTGDGSISLGSIEKKVQADGSRLLTELNALGKPIEKIIEVESLDPSGNKVISRKKQSGDSADLRTTEIKIIQNNDGSQTQQEQATDSLGVPIGFKEITTVQTKEGVRETTIAKDEKGNSTGSTIVLSKSDGSKEIKTLSPTGQVLTTKKIKKTIINGKVIESTTLKDTHGNELEVSKKEVKPDGTILISKKSTLTGEEEESSTKINTDGITFIERKTTYSSSQTSPQNIQPSILNFSKNAPANKTSKQTQEIKYKGSLSMESNLIPRVEELEKFIQSLPKNVQEQKYWSLLLNKLDLIKNHKLALDYLPTLDILMERYLRLQEAAYTARKSGSNMMLLSSINTLRKDEFENTQISIVSNYTDISSLIQKTSSNDTTEIIQHKSTNTLEIKRGHLKASIFPGNLKITGGSLIAQNGQKGFQIAKNFTINNGEVIVSLGDIISANTLILNAGSTLVIQDTNKLINTRKRSAKYHVLNVKTVSGNFEHIIFPEGYKGDTRRLYTEGFITLEERLSVSIASIENTITNFLVYPSPLSQGDNFWIGFNTTNQNRELTLHIFDILGQLHLEKTIYFPNSSGASIQSSNILSKINTNYWTQQITGQEFFNPSSGIYIITLSDASGVLAKTKIGVIPKK